MKKLLLSLIFGLGLLTASASAAEQKSIFVNVTSSDNIKAPMAVMFANKGLQRGIDMTIFLNTEGVKLAVKGYNPPTNAANGKNIHEMLAMFMKKGGKVIVCPMCLKAQGYDQKDLIPGMSLSDADTTFNAILDSDKVISF
jgi:predicted peroxiredoxin